MPQNKQKSLDQLAQKARAWRLAGTHHRGYDAENPLIGKCFDNAYVLYNLLRNHGYSPFMVEGTTERVADTLIQNDESPRQFKTVAQLGGHIHYWIELDDHSDTHWLIDIASDTHDNLGEIVIEKGEIPENYIHLPDSIKEGEKTYHTVKTEDKRCRYCGDHKYTENGCPHCYSILAEDMR